MNEPAELCRSGKGGAHGSSAKGPVRRLARVLAEGGGGVVYDLRSGRSPLQRPASRLPARDGCAAVGGL